MLATFAMPLVLTRYLTMDEYGVFAQFLTLYTALYMVLALGMHTNIFFFYPGAQKREQDAIITNTTLSLIALGLVGGALMAIPGVGDRLFGEGELARYHVYVIACIVLAVPMNMVSPVFSVRADKTSAVVFPAFVAIARIATILVIAITSGKISHIFAGLVVYQVVITLICLIYCGHGTKIRPDARLLKQQLIYAIPFGIAVTLQLLSNYFDKIVSITHLTAAEYAIYSVAFLSIPGINQLYDSLAQMNIINMSKCYQAGAYDQIVPLYRSFIQKTLSFSTPVIFAGALYADEIIGLLFAQEYASAAIYFRIYTLTFLIAMFGAGTILRSVNKTRLSMWAFIISCAIGLPATYFLIQGYGINGAMASAVINIVLPRVIQMGFEIKVTGQRLKDYLPWGTIGRLWVTALMAILPFTAIKATIEMPIYLTVICGISYVGVTYIIYIRKNIFIIDNQIIYSRLHRLTNA